MTILAIDPGSEQSAWVLWDGRRVIRHGKSENFGLLGGIAMEPLNWADEWLIADVVVIEWVASYGMPVGAEVFDTARWAGRYEQAANARRIPTQLVVRRDVKLHLCGQARAKDGNIRQALIDRFGGKDRAIGRKASPGPLYGLRADEWQALALAVTFHDLRVPDASGAVAAIGGL